MSAYKCGHSTETALLRVYSDILTTIGKGNESFLVLLDLSAALDTIDHSVLRNLFLIKKPYSASTLFIAHGILSFYELLRSSICRFVDRVSKNSNFIIMACMTPIVLFIFILSFGNGRDQCYINLHYFYFVIFYYYYVFFYY